MTTTGQRRGGWLRQLMSGLDVAATYQKSWFGKGIIAGIVLATLLVPQGMAYAELAGLPPITGLYTTAACSPTRCSAPPASWCWGRTPRSAR